MWTLILCAYFATGHGAVCEDGGGSGRAGSHPGGGHVLPVSEWQRHHAGLCHCSGRAACQECPHTAYQVSTTTTAIDCNVSTVYGNNKIHVVGTWWYLIWGTLVSFKQMQTVLGCLCTPHA